jgi:hypothetical protein
VPAESVVPWTTQALRGCLLRPPFSLTGLLPRLLLGPIVALAMSIAPFALWPAFVVAQGTSPGEIVTAAAVTRHVQVIAHDSMLGRDTPSRGLELTARYIAEQFAKIGLQSTDSDLSWIQRYRVPFQLDPARSRVVSRWGATPPPPRFRPPLTSNATQYHESPCTRAWSW